MFIATTATKKLLELKKRIRIVAGGTSASKTISILMILIDYAQTHKGELISVVSESFPHLKRGAIRDFLNIMETQQYFDAASWNKTDYTYTFQSGSKLEFFSADQPGKVRGPRRDVLFVNEANNVPFEAYDQLEVRTRKVVWLDHNPVAEYWAYTELIGKRPDVDFITLTYKDNEALDSHIVKTIEARKDNKMWWQVYGLGQLGEVESRIYKGWTIIDAVPDDARRERIGLDFGYTNDPTAVVAVYKWNNGIVLDEVCYRKGMLNSHIANFLTNNFDLRDDDLIIADREPKSIDELVIYGLSVLPAEKGPGSVNHGIQAVQDKTIYVTKRSTNLIREYRNYLWITDKNGKIINKPNDFDNHALDALRYAIADMYPLEDTIKERPKDARIPGTFVKSVEDEDTDSDFTTDTYGQASNEW